YDIKIHVPVTSNLFTSCLLRIRFNIQCLCHSSYILFEIDIKFLPYLIIMFITSHPKSTIVNLGGSDQCYIIILYSEILPLNDQQKNVSYKNIIISTFTP